MNWNWTDFYKAVMGLVGPHDPVFKQGGSTGGGSTAVVAKNDASNLWGLASTSCPQGTWYAKLGIYFFCGLLILFGILGIIFGNKEVDKTVIEAAAA